MRLRYQRAIQVQFKGGLSEIELSTPFLETRLFTKVECSRVSRISCRYFPIYMTKFPICVMGHLQILTKVRVFFTEGRYVNFIYD